MNPFAERLASLRALMRARDWDAVVLTGGVTKLAEADALLRSGKADLVGVGRALFRDARWGENA